MPIGNPNPLEKQLLNLDLSKGLNERDRPETADPSNCLTKVENLVQDQAGAWVKRPGWSYVSLLPDSQPAYKLLQLKDGLGAISRQGKFSQFQEGGAPNGFVSYKGHISEFAMTAQMVGAATNTFGRDTPAASSSASNALFQVTATGNTLTIYDRQAGAILAEYDALTMLVGSAASTLGIHDMACVMVSGGLLHVHILADNAGTGGLYSFIMNLSGMILPPPDTAIPYTLTSLGFLNGPMRFMDLAAGVGSYALISMGGGGGGSCTTFAVRLDNAAAATLVTHAANVHSIFISPAGDLWFITATNIGQANPATLTGFAGGVAHGLSLPPFAGIPNTTTLDGLKYDNRVGLFVDEANIPSVAFTKTTAISATENVQATTFAVGPAMGGTMTASSPLIGWVLAGRPFGELLLGNSVSTVYAHLRKDTGTTTEATTLSTPSTHVVVPMSASELTLNSVPNQDLSSYASVRCAATVESQVGVPNNRTIRLLPHASLVGSQSRNVAILVPVLTNALGTSYQLVGLSASSDICKFTCTNLGGLNYVSGGCHQALTGGRRPAEVGFVDSPIIRVKVSGAGAISGSYRYVAVFRYTDDTGALTWSRVSNIAAAVPASNAVDVFVTPPAVTSKNVLAPSTGSGLSNRVRVDLYRTTNGGTIFYKVPATLVLGGTYPGVYTASDNTTDSALSTGTQLFRQPGTPNSAADRYPPPAGNILVQHKDRLFTTDPLGSRVYYSSFFVDGETAWYNPAFSFFVHGGSGPITGLTSMDGRLFVFKRDAIFVVDGDGPGEAGPSGNEFSPPQRLATEQGCVDHRTIVVTSNGILYRSPQGIQLLGRNLEVRFIGDRVQNTVDAFPYNCGGMADSGGKVHFIVQDDALDLSPNERELIYDFTTDSWSVWKRNPAEATASFCGGDIYTKGRDTIYYASSSGYIHNASASHVGVGPWPWRDFPYGNWVPWTVETGWIKTQVQARQKISKAMVLLKNNLGSNHKVTVSVAYDYNDTYTQVHTFDADVTSPLVVEQLEIQLANTSASAVRLKVEENIPTDTSTYDPGDYHGPDLLGIAFEIAPKVGAPMLASEQRA